jgi:hypothetical protein
MITHDVPQKLETGEANPEWLKLRIGIPTASEFDKIITPTGKASTQWEAYAHKILAEEIVGHAIQGFVKTAAMEEGNARELESIQFYEFQKDVTTEPIGFITDDARTMGCSPDRLVGAEGLLEAKNPLAHTHIGYLLNANVDKEYWPQCQGGLMLAERAWIDIMSHFPEIPHLIVRVERDETYIALMRQMLADFNGKLQNKRKILIDRGYLKEAK